MNIVYFGFHNTFCMMVSVNQQQQYPCSAYGSCWDSTLVGFITPRYEYFVKH